MTYLKQTLYFLITVMMTTTLTFAHYPENSFEFDDKNDELVFESLDLNNNESKNKKTQARAKALNRLNKLITKEKRKSNRRNYNSEKEINKFLAKVDRRLNKESRSAKKLLQNPRALERNLSKLQAQTGKVYDKEELISHLETMSSKESLSSVKEEISQKINQSGSMLEFYQDLKSSIEDNNVANFNKNKELDRKPAYIIDGEFLALFIILSIIFISVIGVIVGLSFMLLGGFFLNGFLIGAGVGMVTIAVYPESLVYFLYLFF